MSEGPARSVRVHALATTVPSYAYDQAYARDRMLDWIPDARVQRLIRRLYDRSGIARRYSVLPDFMQGADARLFAAGPAGIPESPSTGARNAVYVEASKPLGVEVARKALVERTEFDPSDVTHLVTVSCTGFFNPGPDVEIMHQLGLPDSVERYHLGFMGCYAAFPALKMAEQFCRVDPDAVVLIVCIELCTLHLQINGAADSVLANALFADGAAAAIVSAREPLASRPGLVLHGFQSALAPEGHDAMAWAIGDRGFNLMLSSYVPDIIAANLRGITDRALAERGLGVEDIDVWAIHPGGRAILDRIETGLAMDAVKIADSRAILNDFGNMSSATVLFVLERILEARIAVPQSICAMAFGPGLTIETALMTTCPARCPGGGVAGAATTVYEGGLVI